MSIVSYDLLGAAHPGFPLRLAIKLIPAGSAIGLFWETFGDAVPAIRSIAKSFKFPIIRIQVWWDNDHVIVPLSTLIFACKRIEQLAKTFPHVKFYISHSCEHNEQHEPTIRARMSAIREFAPSCIPVNSVWTGKILGDEINERHHAKGKAPGIYINSWDGASCYDGDINEWHKFHSGSLMRFLWGARFNGREVYKQPTPEEPNPVKPPPPMLRTAWPDKKYLLSIIALHNPSGPAPVVPGAIPIERPLLLKTHSEDHPDTDAMRENKPVFILPIEAPKIQIVGLGGEPICECPYGGDFDGGMHRYYSLGLYGYQIANRAKVRTGSPWCLAKAKGKLYGPFHPAYRVGFYQ